MSNPNIIFTTRLEFVALIRWSMRHSRVLTISALGCAVAIGLSGCTRKPSAPPPDGAALFIQRCASCHSTNNDMRAPEPEALHQMAKRAILAALNSGRMKLEARGLSKAQRTAIASDLAAPDSPVVTMTGYCARDLDPP